LPRALRAVLESFVSFASIRWMGAKVPFRQALPARTSLIVGFVFLADLLADLNEPPARGFAAKQKLRG
jgi:hypothetical protein